MIEGTAGGVEFLTLGTEGRGDGSPSGEGSSGGGSVGSPTPPPVSSGNRAGARPTPGRRTSVYIAAALVIVVVVIVLAYALANGFQHTSAAPTAQVLLPRGTSYAIGADQSAGITLTITTPSNLEGTFLTGASVMLYTMNFTDYHALVKTGNVTGYEWAAGPISNQSYYNLDVPIPVGSWVFAFFNPSPTTSVGVTFYTSITLTAS